MKITLNWLREYVDSEGTPESLGDQLTLLGLEVEGIDVVSGAFEGVVVGEVLVRDKHPNADKLSYCHVYDGKEERRIVCGATNFKAGDKVPVALPGAVLPPPAPGEKPWVLQVGKIRGLESFGMLCSAKELGLGVDADGLMILPADAPVGQPFGRYMGRAEGDVVFDLETTPNRPDWNSVIGIAREIAAVTGQTLRLPDVGGAYCSGPLNESGVEGAIKDLLEVHVEAPDLCPRYVARVVRGVRVGPSPEWLRERLEKVGVRSINNVVDITNYVLMETGQPLHAFDFSALGHGNGGRAEIRVRRARAGEVLKTLDGQDRVLDEDVLVIADANHPVALAGIMGGANSEIGPETVDVLIESACFQPAGIRRTSKRLGLRSDASYRYERGADIGICDYASRRAVRLLQELAGGVPVEGVQDVYPAPAPLREIALRPAKVNALLGIDLKPEEIAFHLSQLGLSSGPRKPRPVDVDQDLNEGADLRSFADQLQIWRVPSFRVDLKQEVDLIEEVARLHGVDKIPATTPRGAVGTHPNDSVYDAWAGLRRVLAGLGLYEAQGQTLIHADAAQLALGALSDAEGATCVALENPLSSDMSILRPSLLPGLLAALQHNANRKCPDASLFELGRVFRLVDGQAREGWRLAIALTGRRAPVFWGGAGRDELMDIFDLKGMIEEVLEAWGVGGAFFVRKETGPRPEDLFVESARVVLGGKRVLGDLGQVSPLVARRWDLRHPVFLAELDLDLLLARRQATRSFKQLTQFPSVRRDIAMFVGEQVTHESVVMTIKKLRIPILETVTLFDVYRGAHVPAGCRSLAYALTYRSGERTLKDEEVQAAHAKVLEALAAQLKVQFRDT